MPQIVLLGALEAPATSALKFSNAGKADDQRGKKRQRRATGSVLQLPIAPLFRAERVFVAGESEPSQVTPAMVERSIN